MYYFGTGSNVPAATARDIMEADLMERYHWLPSEIAKIPYKKLQKLFIIQGGKSSAMQSKVQIAQAKQSQHTSGRGQFRREV